MAGTLGIIENTQTHKTLVADSNYGPVLIKQTITAGNYAAGQVLGRLTASGKLTAYDALAANGSELPVAILLQDADASIADQSALVGFAGVYVELNMIGLSAAGKLELEARGIYFK